jgi:hypothetical protein
VSEDKLDQIVKLEEVQDIIEYKNRIPPNIVQKICDIGETSMGGVEFKLIMNDNKEILYNIPLGPGIADYLNLPKGYSTIDIIGVKPAPREFVSSRSDLVLNYNDLNWCAIDDDLILKVIDKSAYERSDQKGAIAALKRRLKREKA